MLIINVFLSLIFLNEAFSQKKDIDQDIFERAARFNLRALDPIADSTPRIFELGQKLFFDKQLSINRNISCSACHSVNLGTSDDLPVGFGEGSISNQGRRFQHNSRVMKRNTPAVFNIGGDGSSSAFWDGRIIRDQFKNVYISPDPGFEANLGRYKALNTSINSVVGVQALFPLITHDEMRGNNVNELSNLEIWDILVKRIENDPTYFALIRKPFSISALANSLDYYQRVFFQTPDTFWDDYLRGNTNALSMKE